jgi:hypothetical protein
MVPTTLVVPITSSGSNGNTGTGAGFSTGESVAHPRTIEYADQNNTSGAAEEESFIVSSAVHAGPVGYATHVHPKKDSASTDVASSATGEVLMMTLSQLYPVSSQLSGPSAHLSGASQPIQPFIVSKTSAGTSVGAAATSLRLLPLLRMEVHLLCAP